MSTASPGNLEAAFAAIKSMYARHARRCVVLFDEPRKYYLATQEVRPDGYRIWFGGVEIKKNYVSAHLIPVYAAPDLLQGVSDRLRRRMQGKSCFNFKDVDASLFAEFDGLISRAVQRFGAEGRLLS